MVTATCVICHTTRRDAGTNAVDQFLVPQSGHEPPGARATSDLQLDQLRSIAGEALQFGANIGGGSGH